MGAKRIERSDRSWQLADHITKFVNSAFNRKLGALGPSRSLVDAVQSALDDGYTEREIRLVYWAARCVKDVWVGKRLSESIQPEIALRHKGGTNQITGKPAVRWLDDLIEKVAEINPSVAFAVWRQLPEDMREGERVLLAEVDIIVHGE